MTTFCCFVTRFYFVYPLFFKIGTFFCGIKRNPFEGPVILVWKGKGLRGGFGVLFVNFSAPLWLWCAFWCVLLLFMFLRFQKKSNNKQLAQHKWQVHCGFGGGGEGLLLIIIMLVLFVLGLFNVLKIEIEPGSNNQWIKEGGSVGNVERSR